MNALLHALFSECSIATYKPLMSAINALLHAFFSECSIATYKPLMSAINALLHLHIMYVSRRKV